MLLFLELTVKTISIVGDLVLYTMMSFRFPIHVRRASSPAYYVRQQEASSITAYSTFVVSVVLSRLSVLHCGLTDVLLIEATSTGPSIIYPIFVEGNTALVVSHSRVAFLLTYDRH